MNGKAEISVVLVLIVIIALLGFCTVAIHTVFVDFNERALKKAEQTDKVNDKPNS